MDEPIKTPELEQAVGLLGQDAESFMEWHEHRAILPKKINGKWIVNKKYWRRYSMETGKMYAYRTVKPKYQGVYYGTSEILNQVQVKMGKNVTQKATTNIRELNDRNAVQQQYLQQTTQTTSRVRMSK